MNKINLRLSVTIKCLTEWLGINFINRTINIRNGFLLLSILQKGWSRTSPRREARSARFKTFVRIYPVCGRLGSNHHLYTPFATDIDAILIFLYFVVGRDWCGSRCPLDDGTVEKNCTKNHFQDYHNQRNEKHCSDEQKKTHLTFVTDWKTLNGKKFFLQIFKM